MELDERESSAASRKQLRAARDQNSDDQDLKVDSGCYSYERLKMVVGRS